MEPDFAFAFSGARGAIVFFIIIIIIIARTFIFGRRCLRGDLA